MNFKECVLTAFCCVASSLYPIQKAYVANGGDTTVSVFDVQTDTAIPPPIMAQMYPSWIGILPNGSKLYVPNTGSNTLTVIETANDATHLVSTGPVPVSLAVTPDGSKVFVVDEGTGPTDGAVTVIETTNDTVVATIGMVDGLGTGPFRAAITLDGTKAFVTNSTDGTVSVINTSTYAVSGPITCGTGATNMALSPDGTQLIVCNFGTNTVTIINTATESVIANVTVGTAMFTGPIAAAFTPDGSKAFVCCLISSEVSMIDTSTFVVNNCTLAPMSQPYGLGITSDGAEVFVIQQGSNEYSVLDASNNTVIVTKPLLMGANPYFIILSPDAASFYVCNAALNSITKIDVATRAIIGSPIPVGINPVFISFLSPSAPTNFTGYLGKNTFLSQTALINILSWEPPANSTQISSYRIYRNAALTDLAGEVSAAGPLVFVDGAKKGQIATYYLVAVDENGSESAAAVTSVP